MPVFAVKHVHFTYWPSHFKKARYDCHFTFKTSLMNHLTTSIVESSVPGATRTCLDDASTLCLIPPVRRRMSCCDSCCHFRCNVASNWRMFCTGGSRACIRRPSMSQIIMLYGIQIRVHGRAMNRRHGFALEVGGYCSCTMRPVVVIHIHRPCS
jgi:hypothetical protein